jgi:hypothetical protein
MAIGLGVASASDKGAPRPDRAADARDAGSLARRIDVRLEGFWAEGGIRPVRRSDDGEFLRRVSLDLVGKIPTAAEARDFIDDPNPDKRSALVDRLLESPHYAIRSAALWRQLLLPEGQADGPVVNGLNDFDAWLRKKVRDETGYDRVVREILTVKLGTKPGDPAPSRSTPTPAAYYSAKGGRPETLASDSARAFLGLRLECAQCHNHPFAKWRREEFWGYAAFFAGVPASLANDGGLTQFREGEAAQRQLTIPGTSTVVKASHLDRSPPAWRPRADSRETLAEWITAPGNPYFARAAVNRTWARFFGEGLVEPVDDLDSAEDPKLGGLLAEMASEFRDHGFDMKFLIRVITATRAYQLTSAVEAGEVTPPPLFARMPVRGLSPAQFIDSLGQATGVETAEARARFFELFADRDERPSEAQTSILQALTLMNGGFMASATSPASGHVLGALAEAPYLDTAGRIETLFLAALARRPRLEEREALVHYVERKPGEAERAQALADVFWALLNGPEFRLNH